jgi:hypothetical protein
LNWSRQGKIIAVSAEGIKGRYIANNIMKQAGLTVGVVPIAGEALLSLSEVLALAASLAAKV